MAAHEACQVWIEQRIKEEIVTNPKSSHRSICRLIAQEVAKMFEAKVNPEAIRYHVKKAAVAAGEILPKKSKTSAKQKVTLPQVPNLTERGGPRAGAGRPAMPAPVRTPEQSSIMNGALGFSIMAITNLKRIMPKDQFKKRALMEVIEWCKKEMEGLDDAN
jgi:hypothetical protein